MERNRRGAVGFVFNKKIKKIDSERISFSDDIKFLVGSVFLSQVVDEIFQESGVFVIKCRKPFVCNNGSIIVNTKQRLNEDGRYGLANPQIEMEIVVQNKQGELGQLRASESDRVGQNLGRVFVIGKSDRVKVRMYKFQKLVARHCSKFVEKESSCVWSDSLCYGEDVVLEKGKGVKREVEK